MTTDERIKHIERAERYLMADREDSRGEDMFWLISELRRAREALRSVGYTASGKRCGVCTAVIEDCEGPSKNCKGAVARRGLGEP